MSYQIIDNFLPEDQFTALQTVIFSASFPWYSSVGVADETDISDKYFVHFFYENFGPRSKFFDMLSPIIGKISPQALLKAKANMYLKNTNLIHHAKHIDFNHEHKGFILYLNTNNGFTVLEDGTQVDSVANRGLFFEAHKLHNSTNCTDELFRANISINYL